MKRFAVGITRFLQEEEGANGVEYALLAGLIAIAFVTGAAALGTALDDFFTSVSLCMATPTALNCSAPFNGT